MSLNVSNVGQCTNKLSNAEEQLRSIKLKLQNFQEVIRNEWKADEMIIVNLYIDSLLEEVQFSSIAINKLRIDINIAVEEIVKEEAMKKEAMKKKTLINTSVSRK